MCLKCVSVCLVLCCMGDCQSTRVTKIDIYIEGGGTKSIKSSEMCLNWACVGNVSVYV